MDNKPSETTRDLSIVVFYILATCFVIWMVFEVIFIIPKGKPLFLLRKIIIFLTKYGFIIFAIAWVIIEIVFICQVIREKQEEREMIEEEKKKRF